MKLEKGDWVRIIGDRDATPPLIAPYLWQLTACFDDGWELKRVDANGVLHRAGWWSESNLIYAGPSWSGVLRAATGGSIDISASGCRTETQREKDAEHLEWIHARLEKVHGEDRLVDYMWALRRVINNLRAPVGVPVDVQETINKAVAIAGEANNVLIQQLYGLAQV